MYLPDQVELLKFFQAFLQQAGLSSVSIKNYLSDLRHFLSFTSPEPSAAAGLTLTTKDIFQNLNQYLDPYLQAQKASFTPANTTARRLASIRRFSTFLHAQFGLAPLQGQALKGTNPQGLALQGVSPAASLSSAKILDQFKTYLEKDKKTPSTVKNYLSDLHHFFLWTANQTPFTDQNLVNILSEQLLSTYVTYLKLSHTSTSVINRRQSSIKKLTKFSYEQSYLPENPFELKATPQTLSPLAWLERLTQRKKESPTPRNRLGQAYDRYHALPWTPYLNLALLVLATTAMAIFAYNQIVSQARPSSAATSLTPPKRQLSFQGRLTDSGGTPITTAVNVVFKLYNALTGPTQLYTTGTCSITPDQDGIFNTLLGDTVCGAEITSTVFTDNRDVYLEITVGAETLTPRQQIATVGYALNSETLQGYPASSSATINTVPVVDNSGNINIAAPSPSLISSSGTFSVQGQVLALKTGTDSGGDVIFQPDALGSGQILALGGTTTEDSFRVTNANLTSGSLLSGYVGNDTATGRLLSLTSGSTETDRFWVAADGRAYLNTNATDSAFIVNQSGAGNLFSASASGVAKFTLNNAGIISLLDGVAHTLDDIAGNLTLTSNSTIISLNDNVTFAGTTTLNSLSYTWPSSQTTNYVLQTNGSGTLSWVAQSAGGSSNWRITAGALSPINDTLDLLVGSTASTSAKFAVLNVNSGTPTASVSAGVAGAAYLTADGNLATTAKQSLTLGNSTTGNIILNAGNVGIGTTGPGANLEVAGQCIEENSLVSTSVGEKKIKDIQSGDQVLSLNEATGQFEYQIVEKTLDMGTKEIYELTTETGKRIETTANHPYLARTKLLKESDIGQQQSNQRQSESNSHSGVDIKNVEFFNIFHNLNQDAINNETIANTKSPVNITNLFAPFTLEKLGTINAAPNQPADKLTNKSETTDDQAGLIDINNTLPQWTKVIYLNKGDEIAVLSPIGSVLNGSGSPKRTDPNGELQFEKIISIRILPAKHVYDLQIANTHNFVANGIVAHNTYINSTATTASVKGLEIAQSGAITGTGYGLYAAKTGASTTNVGGYFSASGATNNYGLIVGAGNVGIGTTGPGANLEIYDSAVSGNQILFTIGSNLNTTAFYVDEDGDTSLDGYLRLEASQTALSSVSVPTIYNSNSGDLYLQARTNIQKNIHFATYNGTAIGTRMTIDNSGNVGVGTTGPDAKLDSLATTEQLRLTYTDGTVYSAHTVDSSGNLTIDNTGTKTIIADDLQITGGDILDSNGNESIRFGTTASAVNEATLTNAATAGTVLLAATGGDTDIALSIDSKGADALNLNGTATGDVNIAGGYGGTGCTVTNSNGNLSCNGTITGTFAGTLPWSSIIAPTANLSLAHAGYTTAFTFDSLTSADAFALSSTSLTTGTALALSSTATAFNGELLTLSKTGSSGSTAFTSDIANVTYSQTFNGGVGLDSTGNVLDLSRAITLNNVGNTHTVSGAGVTVSDSGTQTAGTLTWTGDTMRIAQNYTGANSSALNITTASTDAGTSNFALRVNDDGTFTDSTPFVVDEAGQVGIGTTGPLSKLNVYGATNSNVLLNTLSTYDSYIDLTEANSEANGAFGNANSGGFRMVYDGGDNKFYLNSATGVTINTRLTVDRDTGNVGIGTAGPDAKLDSLALTEQLRLTYTDGTVYSAHTVDSSGNLTIDNTGTKTIIADDLQITGGDILDSNGNESIRFGTTASAVNEATLTNAATAGTVLFAATGGDTDVALSIDSKGADALNLNGTATGDVNLAGGYGGTGCTVTNSNGNLSCNGTITGTFAGTLPWSSIIAPTANLSLAHAGYTTAFTFDSLTSASAFALSSTSTAGGASGVSKLLDISRSGANSNASHTAYGLYSAVTNTGTTSINIGGYFSASGATNNYGLIVGAGNVGIGTTGPGAKLDVRDGNLLLTDTDIAHGMVDFAPTNSILQIKPTHATVGGAGLAGISTSAAFPGIQMEGIIGVDDPTDTTPAIWLSGNKKSGVNRVALGALETVFQVATGIIGSDTKLLSILGNGNVGIGTTGPDAKLDSLATTEQLRLTYTDGTVYSAHTVDSSGNLTIDNTGTKTIIADDLQITGGDILDSNGNESIRFGTTASAVNEATLTNAATGGTVTLAATGGDTDVALSIDSKGADALNLNGTATGDVNLAGGYGGTGCTVTNSNGNLSCNGTITGTFAGTLPWSSIIAPTANLSLAHAGYTTAFTFDSLTSASAFALSSTSTAGGASGVSKLLDISRSGTNANASHTAYGLYSAVTNTGTTSTNVGGYFSASGATNNYGLIVENGSVGIGTTAPGANLEVAGQCITGDSLLSLADGSTQRIDQVKGGEYVLSFNETTGQLEPQPIKGLLNMGVKPVYKLTTKDGKTIRTTGNHPYLVKTSLPSQTEQDQIADDRNNNQSDNNQINVSLHNSSPSFLVNIIENNPDQTTDDSGQQISVGNIPFNHHLTSLANFNEIIKNTPDITSETTKVTVKSIIDLGRAKSGEIAPAENQATAIFPAISEDLPNWPVDNLPIPPNNITNQSNNVKSPANKSFSLGWTKVVDLSPGDEIAVMETTSDLKEVVFVKIASITYVGEEQVWDIEVKNTHNFVANGIVAHNTYINSTATTASIKGLEIAQSGAITGTGYGLYATKTGASTTNVGGYFSASGGTNNYAAIFDAGNVGIGTTGPDAKLDSLATTEQLRLTYTDGTVYSAHTVDSSGNLTIDNTGTKTIIADDLQITGGDILDSNGNESIRFGTTASAVNEATLTNAATAGTVLLAATGGDTDIALSIDSKGADALNLNGTATGDVNLAGGYGGTGCTVTNSNGNLSCNGTITGTFAGTLPWSSIIAPTANLSLAHAGYTTAFTFDSVTTADAFALASTSLTTGTLFDLSSTSTAGGASGVSKLLDISRSGTNSNASHTAYGLYSAVTNTGTTSTNIGGYFSASGATNNYGLLVENGNVGIGTTGPGSKLQIDGGASGNDILRIIRESNANNSFAFSAPGNDALLVMKELNAGTAWAMGIDTSNSDSFTLSQSTAFGTNDYFTVVGQGGNAGNVGIGTTAPSNPLHIAAQAPRIRLEDTLGTSNYSVISADNGQIILSADEGSQQGNSAFIVKVDNSEKLRVDSSGNVGIGTLTPDKKLSVWGGDGSIMDPTDLGTESLTNGNLTAGTSWTQTTDCALATDAATCTFAAGTASTVQQASGTLAVAGVGSRWYKFVYTVSGLTGTPTANITTAFASATTALTLTAGTQTTYFKSATTPTDFVITTTLTAGQAFTLDTFSLKEVQGGDFALGGILTGGGTTGLKVLANGNVGVGTVAPDSKFHTVGGDVYIAPDTGYTFDNGTANEDLYVYGNAEVDGTLYATDVSCVNCLDFSNFEDTLDLDANLILNQTTFTWTQNFTGDTTTGVTYNANSLTTGTAISLASTSTALTTGGLLNITASGNPGASWTGNLAKIEYTTSTDADIDGSALKVGITGAGAGDGTALNVTTAQTGTSAYALRVNDDGTYTDTTPFVVDYAGNVGIGTTAPAYKLDVVGDVNITGNYTVNGSPLSSSNWQRTSLSLAPAQITDSVNLGATATSSALIHLSGSSDDNQSFFMNPLGIGFNSVTTPITNALAVLETEGHILPHSDLTYSLGSSTQTWTGLYVNQIADDSGTATIDVLNNQLTNGDWKVASKLRIGSTVAPTFNLDVTGTATISGTLGTESTLYVKGDSNLAGTVTVGGGSGKMDVGTVDPPYTINGEKYATYLSSTIGIKEEVMGKITVSEAVDGLGYRVLIDLDAQPKGSDLWLFSKTTDLKANIDSLSVLLTAAGQAKTWYEVDEPNKILAIYSSTPADVTYRLTAPRFDSAQWANTRTSGAVGFVLNDPDNNQNTAGTGLLSSLIIAPELIAKVDGSYQVKINGQETKEVSSFFQSLIANLKVGAQVVTDLVATNLTVRTKLISPIADIDQLKVIDATISGTLYADNIKGKTVDHLTTQLDLLSEKYSTASAILADLQAKYTSYDSLALGTNNSAPITDSDPLALSPLATTSATLPSDLVLDSLLVNGSLFAQSFSSFDSDLYIQPTGDKPVHLLANLMTLYPDGKIVVNGDLLITGTIYSMGLDTRTATVSGTLAAGGLIIASDNLDQTATISAQTGSNTTIGTATIASGSAEIVVANQKVTDQTLIYLTPISDTSNQVLYVKSKQAGTGFTVAVPASPSAGISFNYWLVETK